MLSIFDWNIYLGPILLGFGVAAQCSYVLWPRLPFRLAVAGASLVLAAAFHALDSTLLLGQLLMLPLLWLWRKKA